MKFKSINIFILLSLIFFVQLSSYSQTVTEGDVFRCENYANQYEIQVVNTRDKLNLPITICDLISENQSDSKIVTVQYSKYVRIKIYPKNNNLVLPKKEVVYVSE